MDITEIQARINALSDAMLAKGMRRPEPRAEITAHMQFGITVWWQVAKGRGIAGGNNQLKMFKAATLAEAFVLAEAFIAEQPSPEEAKQREFMTALGAVIDLGRETGIEVAYVNPLVETMKRLSENALTFRPAPVA